MKIKLSELRQLIREAMDPMELYVLGHNDCVLIDDKKHVRGAMSLKFIPDLQAFQVTTVYAKDPRAAVALFSSALIAYDRLIPDRSLSPAAKAIILHWYSRHKDDGSIEKAPEMFGYSGKHPAFASIYTAPEGMTSPVPIVTNPPNAERKRLKDQAWEEFDNAYANLEKTGKLNLNAYVSKEDWKGLQDVLVDALDKGTDSTQHAKALSWIKQNAEKLSAMNIKSQSGGMTQDMWKDFADTYDFPQIFV